ncbi:MAG TPA: lactonase family protein [Cyclobacteriaceae bacterium]|nr:lactonase family protein [Cyclobacteriaceae bacterium]HPW61942.1 lactonase family protein [Cyclobacteriaceae bacterium]
MKHLILLFICLMSLTTGISQPKGKNFYLIVGTYTNRTSEGIYVYEFNTTTGESKAVSVATGLKNPSFLTIAPDGKNVYAVAENEPDGGVYALQFDAKAGQLKLINEQLSKGAHPCYIDIDQKGKWLVLANYTGGSVSVLPVNSNKSIGELTQNIPHTGSSVNPERQTSPHPHSAVFAPRDNNVFVPDLGQDKIIQYQLDPATGTMKATGTIQAVAGSGPRHLAFHPNKKFAYVINELNATITAYQYGKTLTPIQTVKTLPDDFKEQNWCADIHLSPDGRFLYGTNRGHNSIVSYKVDPATGQLTFLERQDVHGKWPRNFMIDPTGNFLLVANQETDNIAIFKRDQKTGKIQFTGNEIKLSMPVCLRMIAQK